MATESCAKTMGSQKCDEDDFVGPWWQHPELRNALVAGILAGIGFVAGYFGIISQSVANVFYWVAIPIGGYHWAREGIEKLFREREVGIEILMLAATVASGFIGLWDEAAVLVFLYGAAEGVEELTYARTRHAIRALLDLAPKEARLLRDGKEVTVPAESLVPGDIFIVRPGELIPTDGVIKSGASSVNESQITGESVPVEKGPGKKVFAGSINCQGALVIEGSAAFTNNTLTKIIRLVETAQEQKGRAQQWIERFGRFYSPAILIASVLVALVPWMLGIQFADSFLRAVLLLVAAAPCALVMSTPVAMAAGIGAAGKRGILIKGGAHLEQLGNVRVVAFDKTGTLTCGRPLVTDVLAIENDEHDLLSIAAGLEYFSEHPLGKAIISEANARGIVAPKIEHFEALVGYGVTADIQGEKWYLGGLRLFARFGLNLEHIANQISDLEAEGKTVILVGRQTSVAGLIAFRDELRAGVPHIIASLHAFGIRTAMLTGDNRRTAQVLAEQAGIDDVYAELVPENKVAMIHLLEKQYGPVLMVGDGINDAPALASATCGMAMGAAGADAAIEAADVALMGDDLAKIMEAIKLGRFARRVSLQNIVGSVLMLIILIPLALGAALSVTTAVLAHEISELLAVANGLRVGKKRF